MSTPTTEPGLVPVSDPHALARSDIRYLERRAEHQRRQLDATLARLGRLRREQFQREVAEAESTPRLEF